MATTSLLATLAAIVAAVFGVGIASLLCFPAQTSLYLTCLLLLVGLVIFLTTRHIQLVSRRRNTKLKEQIFTDGRRRSQDYHLFVLGSGGHTKEMLMMMDDGFCDFANFHRRYLISSGDRMSVYHLGDYEADLEILCALQDKDPGTHDTCIVTRARRVHQPLWSTPFTALLSILDIFPALLTPPAYNMAAKLQYPTCIFSNGPATGFFVGVAAHLLKMFYLVPENTMQFVYIESWARISTLSLTGKLFYYTGIADVLVVQHEQVAAKYGIENCGEMVFNARRPDI
ncbi:glycosyltransferase family 1 [Fusarium albosuccineum]|uniref:UDP-N-acetylglucosamine transferase subunit ALG14 n=1 Tax=Fusarium albosuccineum TaxID=1237068 RepID=A0A8H4LQ78_9HYPO|nr:glycosyltransferase family 1 [Fusarium albosuccineum]